MLLLQTDGCEFYAGYPGGGFADYFPPVHHGVAEHPGLPFLTPPPTSVSHVVPTPQQHADHLIGREYPGFSRLLVRPVARSFDALNLVLIALRDRQIPFPDRIKHSKYQVYGS